MAGKKADDSDNKYMRGFGNYFISEAEPDTVPKEQNNPQKVKNGLFAEQISGTSFMLERVENRHSWLYKIKPSVGDYQFKVKKQATLLGRPFKKTASPNQFRWRPLAMPQEKTDFIDGLFTICGNGSPETFSGSALHIYRANCSMKNKVFANHEAEMIFVPELGRLNIFTELGEIEIEPGEICVIPNGIKFRIDLFSDEVRGYVLENFGRYFRLPELGVIGANGLAYPEHFLYPEAKYEKYEGEVELIIKFEGQLWTSLIDGSPLDVVAWKGNYCPYKYDLDHFQVLNTVSFDHVDPSIFTVLSSPSHIKGMSNVDFSIFPPRWLVAEHTFRPPYFHRNCASELMGLIFGEYESRTEGFLPGGLTLHNTFSAHGPDIETYEKSINQDLRPYKLEGTLAFLFESYLVYQPSDQALLNNNLDKNYTAVWEGYRKKSRK